MYAVLYCNGKSRRLSESTPGVGTLVVLPVTTKLRKREYVDRATGNSYYDLAAHVLQCFIHVQPFKRVRP